MNHEIIKQVIYGQREIIRRAVINKREYTFEPSANYILTGIRRTGKSTILYSIVRKPIEDGADWNQIIYVNFEDERLAGFTLNDFSDLEEVSSELSDKTSYYFLDQLWEARHNSSTKMPKLELLL